MGNILTRRREMIIPKSGEDSSDGYYNKNLLIRLDGINNTRQGHQSNITSWENLVSSDYDFSLINPVVNADSVYFPSECGAVCEEAFTLPADFTYEICFSLGNDVASIANDSALLKLFDSSGYWSIALYKWNQLYCYIVNGQYAVINSSPVSKDSLCVIAVSVLNNSKKAKAYVNGVLVADQSCYKAASKNITKIIFNEFNNGKEYSKTMLPTIRSFRLYTDALSDDEILANYANDITRFS